MKTIFDWIDQRSGLISFFRGACNRQVPGGACCCGVWPCAILFAFCMQAITGFFLWIYYSPSAQTAWESVYYLQYHVQKGWLLRAMHHYSAHVLIAMSLLYVLQLILSGRYRAPRELVFWTAVIIGLFALGAVLTGDLLYYDQNGYSSTKVRTGFLTLIPAVGDKLLALAIGGPGPDLGSHALTRFFALHVGVFGGGLIVLLILQSLALRRAGQAAIDGGAASEPFWPEQAWRNAAACLIVLGVVLLLACRHGTSGDQRGVFLGSPADPANAYDAARPEWMLLGVYEFSHMFPGGLMLIPIFIVPGLVAGYFLLMPWVAKLGAGRKLPMQAATSLFAALGVVAWYFLSHKFLLLAAFIVPGLAVGYLASRPFFTKFGVGHWINAMLALGLLISVSLLTWESLDKDRANAKHHAAIAAEHALAQRAKELADGEGIPAGGALALLRSDPKSQGPRLFQQCASCHSKVNAEGIGIKAEKPSAPNLEGYASRKWIAGILDAKQIVGENYFGSNPKFRRGEMVNFVKEMWKDAEDDEEYAKELKGEIEAIAAGLSAEAHLKSQQAMDAKDGALIAKGRELITERCTDCHRFGAKKGAGAPELTGYGSEPWLRGIIANPADARFYGSKNDRMPAYKDVMTAKDIDLVTKYLRGEWREPGE